MAMEMMSHILSSAESIGAIGASLLGGTAAAVAGKVPRVGPLRAIVLGISSRYHPRFTGATVSQRAAEVARLNASLSAIDKDQFVVVNGPKGVGKSCLVDTAVRDGWGVVKVSVSAGKSMDEITAATWRAVTRSQLSISFDHTASAQRVLFFHKLFFPVPVTVILQAAERRNGQDYADISAACRQLVAIGNGNIRVIVDASHNSLDESARATMRERVLQVEPMPRELVEALSGLETLHAALSASGVADVAWAVLGGYPAAYKGLRTAWQESGYCKNIAPIVEAFVQEQLETAINVRSDALAADKRLKPLYERFTTSHAVPSVELETMEVVRPSPDKVLRRMKVKSAGETMLVPTTPAMALVLRHNFSKVPPLDEIKALVSPSLT